MTPRMHREAGQIWVDISRDPTVAVVVVTSEGKGGPGTPGGFCAGSTLETSPRGGPEPNGYQSQEDMFRLFTETRDLVLNMINCNKVIISAKIGVAAGDHAAMIWPLCTGMAKAKYYTLTGEILDAKEAERIGLISKLVGEGESLKEAMRVGTELALGPQHALKHTKR